MAVHLPRQLKIPRLPDADALTAELRELLTALINEAKETNAHLAALRADLLREREGSGTNGRR